MNSRTLAPVGGALAAALALSLAAPQPASACGGFFCNNQAIDQSGEDILFSYNDDGSITTVVQIRYTGPSEEFGWILPVPAEPAVSVGSDAMFAALRQRTNPVFTTEREVLGTCRSEPSCYDSRNSFDDFDGERGPPSPGAAADGGAQAPEVDVRFQGDVGSFEVAVLAANDAMALRTWLADNGFVIPPEAGAELDHYVALDHFFVALKLLKNREAGEITPIVLRSSNDEPCIPLRLTRIAAVEDMPVTAYFLADRRARPLNFMLVEPDLDDVGLYTGGTQYRSLVTQATNDAGGHAFVTDYAGAPPSGIVLRLQPIDDLATETDPGRFLQELRNRGFSGDSQLLSILLRLVPPPEGWDPQSYYNCLFSGGCQSDPPAIAFDPQALVDTLNELIVQPRIDAEEMIASHAHMTRLFSTLSPSEMTVDPMFTLSDELAPEHSNVHTATRQIHCGPEYFEWSAPVSLVLPSGRSERIREGVPYNGSDDSYCEDRYSGDFRPGASEDRLREVSREREVRGDVSGSGLCSVSAGPGSAAAASVFGFAMLGLGVRRRRRRQR